MVQIETFENPFPKNDYVITHINEEFTSVCPVTGLPDFGRVILKYIPDEICVELKSLKYYYLAFRDQGIYYEAVTNQILNDLVEVCSPKFMEITTEWTVRGGIHSTICAKYEKK
jgi:7-cyano-7-deazaguanine reductase